MIEIWNIHINAYIPLEEIPNYWTFPELSSLCSQSELVRNFVFSLQNFWTSTFSQFHINLVKSLPSAFWKHSVPCIVKYFGYLTISKLSLWVPKRLRVSSLKLGLATFKPCNLYLLASQHGDTWDMQNQVIPPERFEKMIGKEKVV